MQRQPDVCCFNMAPVRFLVLLLPLLLLLADGSSAQEKVRVGLGFSYLGRRGNGQAVSLDRQGCLYHSTVQHELLHALGFNHEQCRSDRDQHIRVLWQNIQPGSFKMFAFSGNNMPTMEPIPNANVEFGTATEMSRNDIDRLNRLYKCSFKSSEGI